MDEPKITRPAFIKYSLLIAGANHFGRPIVFLISRPIVTAMNTDSKPSFLIYGIVLMYWDKIEIANIATNDTAKGIIFSPISFTPTAKIGSVAIKLNKCVWYISGWALKKSGKNITAARRIAPINVDRISSFFRNVGIFVISVGNMWFYICFLYLFDRQMYYIIIIFAKSKNL